MLRRSGRQVSPHAHIIVVVVSYNMKIVKKSWSERKREKKKKQKKQHMKRKPLG